MAWYTCRRDVSAPGEPERLCLKPTVSGAKLCADCQAQDLRDSERRAKWPFWPGADEPGDPAWFKQLLEAGCDLYKEHAVAVNLYATILLPDEVAYFNDDGEIAAAYEQLIAAAWEDIADAETVGCDVCGSKALDVDDVCIDCRSTPEVRAQMFQPQVRQ